MNKAYYSEYYNLERNHWWFLARSEILKSILSKFIYQSSPIKILNVGIATGATSIMLESFGEVTSLEYDQECCEFVKKNIGINVIQGSLTELPFKDSSFDLVCAFDVLEHIENHQDATKEIERVLKTGGTSFITVPAYKFLWSEHDDINHHYRRYTRRSLRYTFQQSSNLKEIKSSYFNSVFFAPIAIVRLLSKLKFRKNKEIRIQSDFQKFKSNSLMNKLLFHLFKCEKYILVKKFSFPFGVSIFSILKK